MSATVSFFLASGQKKIIRRPTQKSEELPKAP